MCSSPSERTADENVRTRRLLLENIGPSNAMRALIMSTAVARRFCRMDLRTSGEVAVRSNFFSASDCVTRSGRTGNSNSNSFSSSVRVVLSRHFKGLAGGTVYSHAHKLDWPSFAIDKHFREEPEQVLSSCRSAVHSETDRISAAGTSTWV